MAPRGWEPAGADPPLSPLFPRPEASRSPGRARRCPAVAAQVRGGGWKALVLQRERGMRRYGQGKGRLHLLQARREGMGRENRIAAARRAWDLLTCVPEGRGRGDCGSGAAGREGAMGEGPERGGSAAEPGTRCDTAGDRAGRATRCGGDSGHRGDTAATPRGKDGGGLPVPPASLPPVSSPSLTLCMAFRIKASS